MIETTVPKAKAAKKVLEKVRIISVEVSELSSRARAIGPRPVFST